MNNKINRVITAMLVVFVLLGCEGTTCSIEVWDYTKYKVNRMISGEKYLSKTCYDLWKVKAQPLDMACYRYPHCSTSQACDMQMKYYLEVLALQEEEPKYNTSRDPCEYYLENVSVRYYNKQGTASYDACHNVKVITR